jgi:hypothetical protein
MSASPHSWPSCRGVVWPMASRKMRCKNTVCSKHRLLMRRVFSRDGIANFHYTHV